MSAKKKVKRGVPICAWPKCGQVINPLADFVPVVGESTGKVYACSTHRNWIETGKAVLGTAAIAGFREGMDRSFPGVREKIGSVGSSLFDLFNDVRTSMAKGREPAE